MTQPPDRSYPGLVRFDPHLEILDTSQLALWSRLDRLPRDAVLYGSTVLPVIREGTP